VAGEPAVNGGTLQSVMALYGISEEQAIVRLARETDAAETWMRIRRAGLSGYAGAWFNGESLLVAANQSDDHEKIVALDAVPVAVSFSLVQLSSRLGAARDRVGGIIISSHIDFVSNRVVLSYDRLLGDERRALLRDQLEQGGFDLAHFELRAADPVVPSSGPVRGGDGTRNRTWEKAVPAQNGLPRAFACSIGVAIEGGYVTAGHCGEEGHEMVRRQGGYQTYSHPDCLLQPTITGKIGSNDLGEVEETLYFQPPPVTDSGWVPTISGWTPVAEINGYSDGTLPLPSIWSGLLQAPVGATVCRYGQSSGGPHCGSVSALDVTLGNPLAWSIRGLTEVAGSCTVDGDSGGPWISGSGQVQGTMFGSACPHVCPSTHPNPLMYFQPITDALSTFGKTMLTTHGPSAPSANVTCPMAGSNEGNFLCRLDSWHSQGVVDWNWSSGTNSSSSLLFSGTCIPGNWTVVQLAIENPYGTNSPTYGFMCPDDSVIDP